MTDPGARYLSPGDAAARICEFERKHGLFQYEVDGWRLWPLFRFSVARRLQSIPRSSHDNELSRAELAKIAGRDVRALLSVKNATYLAKTYSSSRRAREGDLYKDVYFDDLLRELGDHFKLESIANSTMYPLGKRALIASDMTTVAFDYLAGKLAGLREPPRVTEMARELSRLTGDDLGVSFPAGIVAAQIMFFWWAKRIYSLLLKRIRPRYLFLADAGEFAIKAAAKEMGVVVIEFQHGLINRHHPSFSWPATAKAEKKGMLIPDHVFLYGDYWKEELGSNGFWDKELVAVGNVMVDQYRRRKPEKNRDHCNIILTTSGENTTELIEFVRGFLDLARGKVPVKLFVKMHPGYESNKNEYLDGLKRRGDVQVVAGNEEPSTLELMSKAQLHLSIYSTCHYEALALGVPTVVIPLKGHENALHLYEHGHAHLARSPGELAETVRQWKELKVKDEVGEYYYKDDALENIKRQLSMMGA